MHVNIVDEIAFYENIIHKVYLDERDFLENKEP